MVFAKERFAEEINFCASINFNSYSRLTFFKYRASQIPETLPVRKTSALSDNHFNFSAYTEENKKPGCPPELGSIPELPHAALSKLY